MLRNIIKYGGLALVIIGIVLVMKNLFNSDAEFESKKNTNSRNVTKSYYSATVNLMDEETKKYLVGASLVVKDAFGNVVTRWTTEEKSHLVSNLKAGTYTLEEETAPEGYKSNDTITFIIKDKNRDVTMLNKKMTEEEKKAYEEEQRKLNTTSDEVNVDNTLSEKDVVTVMMAIVCMVSGIFLVSRKRDA